jgi:hypothetical protein
LLFAAQVQPLPGIDQECIAESFAELNDLELRTLVTLALTTMQTRGMPPPVLTSLAPANPNINGNSGFEQILFAGNSSKYDGSSGN